MKQTIELKLRHFANKDACTYQLYDTVEDAIKDGFTPLFEESASEKYEKDLEHDLDRADEDDDIWYTTCGYICLIRHSQLAIVEIPRKDWKWDGHSKTGWKGWSNFSENFLPFAPLQDSDTEPPVDDDNWLTPIETVDRPENNYLQATFLGRYLDINNQYEQLMKEAESYGITEDRNESIRCELRYHCGHSSIIQLFPSNWDSLSEIRAYQRHDHLCPSCYKKRCETELLAWEKQNQLPALTDGTNKEIEKARIARRLTINTFTNVKIKEDGRISCTGFDFVQEMARFGHISHSASVLLNSAEPLSVELLRKQTSVKFWLALMSHCPLQLAIPSDSLYF